MKKSSLLLRCAALLVGLALLLPAGAFAQASFPDVEPGSWYEADVNALARDGLVNGFEDGTFRPHNYITSAQFVIIVARCAGLSYDSTPSFHWAAPQLRAAMEAGWYDWDELPPSREQYEEPITRQLAVKVLMRALLPTVRGDYDTESAKIHDFSSLDGWYYDTTLAAYSVGVARGDQDGNFRPLSPLTRAEACALIQRARAQAEQVPEPTPAESMAPVPTSEPDDPSQVSLVPWGEDQVVEHLFFHPVIAYPQWAFHDCPSSQAEKEGLDDWMVTAGEYKKILQSLYDKGYILVSMNEVWSEYTDENGDQRMRRNVLMLPEGKKPLILSFDDINYYDYMLEEGFTSKLVVGTDGEIWAECTDPYTGETFLTQDLDAVTILDKFIREHPDFSLHGTKGCLSLTGYAGILGYRTQRSVLDWNDEKETFRLAEREAVMPVIQRLKETGWYFGSHTWGHIRLDTRSLEYIKTDTERWFRDVGELVGETNIFLYPHGARPDGGHDQGETYGEQFQWLQSQGFRIFASVGLSSVSQVKETISAVICDRLHPDGTTLRKSRELYLRFYDAKDIIDLDVRPDLGVSWQ